MLDIPKMDLSWIPLKMNCELCGEEFKIRPSKKYCSSKCRQKALYNTNEEFRLKKIEKSREVVENKRGMDKLKKKREMYDKLLEESKVKVNDDVIALFNAIYRK
jgi:hypothetical protein